MTTTTDALRALIGRIGISQRHAARLLGISERTMRGYLASPDAASYENAPAYILFALEGIMSRIDTIRASVTSDLLADYMTAENGDLVAVFHDGSYRIYGSGEVPARDFDALATAKCPGAANLDSSELFADWAEMDEETGQYIVTGKHHDDRGRVIGDLEDAIRECCRDGDMTRYQEKLERELIASVLEA